MPPAPELMPASPTPPNRRQIMAGLLALGGTLPNAATWAATVTGVHTAATEMAPVLRDLAIGGDQGSVWAIDALSRVWRSDPGTGGRFRRMAGGESVGPRGNSFTRLAAATSRDGRSFVFAVDMYGHPWAARAFDDRPLVWREAGTGAAGRALRRVSATPAMHAGGEALQLAAIDDEYRVWTAARALDTGAWSSWTRVSAETAPETMLSVSASAAVDGDVILLGLGSRGELWTTCRAWASGRWSAWEPYERAGAVPFRDAAALDAVGSGTIALGRDGTLWIADALEWQPLSPPDLPRMSSLAACRTSEGTVSIRALSNRGELWQADSASGWRRLTSASREI